MDSYISAPNLSNGFHGILFEYINKYYKSRDSPDIALENMVNVTTIGGHIIIHTQNPQMAYHKCPVDCLRFFKDWFIEMQKYLPIKLVEWNEFGPHMFCVYERVA
jgi:hypothetical protein